MYFPNFKYFNKNSYIDYEGAVTRPAIEWYMDTSSKINMGDSTPAIGYDTVTGDYIVIKSKRKHINIISNLGKRLELSLPVGIFCCISLLLSLIFFCIYLSEAVEDAERAALLLNKNSLADDIFLNNSQETIPKNYGMSSADADRFKQNIERQPMPLIELLDK